MAVCALTTVDNPYDPFLKLGMRAHRLELQLMEQELELRRAKTEAIKASKTRDELYDKVMKAMRRYQGAEEEEDQNDEY